MKRFIYITLCVVASMIGVAASAQMRSSYFMQGSYFRNELNPALAPTRGYVALPLMMCHIPHHAVMNNIPP